MENGKFDDVDSVKLGKKKKLNQTIDLKAKKKTFVRFDSIDRGKKPGNNRLPYRVQLSIEKRSTRVRPSNSKKTSTRKDKRRRRRRRGGGGGGGSLSLSLSLSTSKTMAKSWQRRMAPRTEGEVERRRRTRRRGGRWWWRRRKKLWRRKKKPPPGQWGRPPTSQSTSLSTTKHERKKERKKETSYRGRSHLLP